MTEKKKVRVLITVKTYPTFSVTHEEVVCTAGFTEVGKWIRLYPIPFRRLDYASQYKKYDWVEVEVKRYTEDFRSETYCPIGEIKQIGHAGTTNNWRERKDIVLKEKVYTNINELVKKAKQAPEYKSLTVFKPTKILGVSCHETTREWDANKLKVLDQLKIFESYDHSLKPVKKLPYTFTYKFEDDAGTDHNMMIRDWELGALYWKCLAKHRNDEKKACEDVKRKYYDDFAKTKDLYLFLGSMREHHMRASNPFIIIGTFHPKRINQSNLFEVM